MKMSDDRLFRILLGFSAELRDEKHFWQAGQTNNEVIDVDESGRCARKPQRLQHATDGVQYSD